MPSSAELSPPHHSHAAASGEESSQQALRQHVSWLTQAAGLCSRGLQANSNLKARETPKGSAEPSPPASHESHTRTAWKGQGVCTQCLPLGAVLCCGQEDQQRGKVHGFRAGHKVKGRPAPITASEWMHFSGKPPGLSTETFPLGAKQPHLSLQMRASQKTHPDAPESSSCSPRQEGQFRPKQL